MADESFDEKSSQSPSNTDMGAIEQNQSPPYEKASATEKSHESKPTDPSIVDWEGEADPQKPVNWTARAKVFNVGSVVAMCLLTPLASSMFAPGVPEVLRTFRSDSQTLAEFVVSIYILGFAVGPLIISPLSEIYGRRPVYVICNVMFLIFTIACAVAGSLTQLIVFRFFAGCFGVAPVTLGGATIADLVVQEKRGASMALFGMGPLMGPVIGPVCGAYISARVGWRWTFWVIAIAYGVVTIFHFVACPETYASVILDRKTKKLRKETGDTQLRSALDDGYDDKTRLKIGIVRPTKMLLMSPIVFFMALYVAIVYAILYLLYTTFTFVFEENYHFSSENVGLTYIANGIGMFIGLFLIGGLSDRILKAEAAKNDGELKPEYRLVLLCWTCWFAPIGLFIYGWTAQYHEQWAVPLFGTLLFGFGIISAMITIQQYLIDAFERYAASAIAANTVLRSILGGLLPLAGLDMYKAIGLGWGNSLIAFIALAMIPVAFVFRFRGERIRAKTKIAF